MLILLTSAAFAQNIDVPEGLNTQTFRPSVDAQQTIWTDESLLADDKSTTGRVLMSYTSDPLAFVNGLNERTELVSDIYQLDLLGAHTRGPIRIGLDVPLYLRSNGETAGGETGLGDISANVRYTALNRRTAPIGAALAVNAIAPTSTVDAPIAFDGLAYEISAIVDKEIGNLLVAVNVGHRGQPEVALDDIVIDDQFATRAGIAYAFSDKTGIATDFATYLTYSGQADGSPMEILGSAYQRVSDDFVLRLGAGGGLNNAVGSPGRRVLAALVYQPAAADSDRDGILDLADDCPTDPEDMDGIADADGCPETTQVNLSFVNADGEAVDGVGWRLGEASGVGAGNAGLYGGAYTLEASLEGYEPVSRTQDIPDAESVDVVVTMDAEGLPGTLLVSAVDNEGNAVEGAQWQLRGTELRGQEVGTPIDVPSGEYNLIVTADGYTPVRQDVVVEYRSVAEVVLTLEETDIVVTQEQIEIQDTVYFETNRSVIRAESHGLLDDISSILVANPELKKVRIEGHTDSRGAAEHNQELSQARAEAVRTYLIERGVEAERLDAVGYGESQPVAQGNNEAAWSQNRRVAFMVVERGE